MLTPYSFISELYRTPIWEMEEGALFYYRDVILASLNKTSVIQTEFEKRSDHPRLLIFGAGRLEHEERLLITESAAYYKDKDFKEDDQVINLIPLTGPITKGGAVCSYGTRELADRFTYAEGLSHVVGHLVVFNTPGGSANANDLNELFANAKKPVVGLMRGDTASKGVHMASFIPYVFAERNDIEIGSVGTYAAFSGKQHEALYRGEKYVEVYASQSTEKNLEYREAIQNANYKPLQEMLDKHSETFASNVRRRWPNVKDERLHGKMYPAGEVVGELVDGIKSYAEAIEFIFEKAGVKRLQKGTPTPVGMVASHQDDEVENHQEVVEEKINTNPQTPKAKMDIAQLQAILGKETTAEVDEQGQVVMTQELSDRVIAAALAERQAAATARQQAATLAQEVIQQKAELEELSKETRPLVSGVPQTDGATENETIVTGSILDGVNNPAERLKIVKSFAQENGIF
jgi:hypothetical protein